MLPFNTDEAWPVIEAATKSNNLDLVITILTDRLEKAYQLAPKQATVVAEIISKSKQNPTEIRARIVGVWEALEEKGIAYSGAYRSTIYEYNFRRDFTYELKINGFSSYMSPSYLTHQIQVAPNKFSSNSAGVYVVSILEQGPSLCLCSVNTGTALLKHFGFSVDGKLVMDGLRFKKLR